MSEYNYGSLEHELAGGNDTDNRSAFDQVFEDMSAPEYPATCDGCGEVGTNASMEGHECDEAGSLKSLSALLKDPSYMTLPRVRQIAIKHAHWNATTLPNNEFSLSWQDMKVLLDENTALTDRLAAQAESLAQVVEERNRLREERERLLTTLRQARNAARVFTESEYLSTAQFGLRDIITHIDKALATSETEEEG